MNYNSKHLIGVTIKKLRLEYKYSQHTLGIESDIDIKYIGKIERGQVNISVEKLISICEVFNLSLIDFFCLLNNLQNDSEITSK